MTSAVPAMGSRSDCEPFKAVEAQARIVHEFELRSSKAAPTSKNTQVDVTGAVNPNG